MQVEGERGRGLTGEEMKQERKTECGYVQNILYKYTKMLQCNVLLYIFNIC